jgi:hypothetical protein
MMIKQCGNAGVSDHIKLRKRFYVILFEKETKESRWLTQYRYKATGWTTGVRFPAGAILGCFSLRHRIKTDRGGPHSFLSKGYGDGLFRRG